MGKKMVDYTREEINEMYQKVTHLVESAAFANESEGGTNKWMVLADLIVDAKELQGKENAEACKQLALVILGYKMGIEAAKRQQMVIGSSLIKEAKEILKKFGG